MYSSAAYTSSPSFNDGDIPAGTYRRGMRGEGGGGKHTYREKYITGHIGEGLSRMTDTNCNALPYRHPKKYLTHLPASSSTCPPIALRSLDTTQSNVLTGHRYQMDRPHRKQFHSDLNTTRGGMNSSSLTPTTLIATNREMSKQELLNGTLEGQIGRGKGKIPGQSALTESLSTPYGNFDQHEPQREGRQGYGKKRIHGIPPPTAPLYEGLEKRNTEANLISTFGRGKWVRGGNTSSDPLMLTTPSTMMTQPTLQGTDTHMHHSTPRSNKQTSQQWEGGENEQFSPNQSSAAIPVDFTKVQTDKTSPFESGHHFSAASSSHNYPQSHRNSMSSLGHSSSHLIGALREEPSPPPRVPSLSLGQLSAADTPASGGTARGALGATGGALGATGSALSATGSGAGALTSRHSYDIISNTGF